jgi:DNA-binding MarR family transcriptional regulator
VTRGSGPGHRGVVTLGLTAIGQDLVRQVTARREQELARIMQQFPPAGRTQLIKALSKLIEVAGEGYGLIFRGLIPA